MSLANFVRAKVRGEARETVVRVEKMPRALSRRDATAKPHRIRNFPLPVAPPGTFFFMLSAELTRRSNDVPYDVRLERDRLSLSSMEPNSFCCGGTFSR